MTGFGSLFSTRYLTDNPTTLPGVYYGIYTGLLALGLLASIYVYVRRRPLSRGITPRRHLLRMMAQAGMYIFTIGLFFALMRYTEVLYVDMRIYSYLVILAVIGYAGYLTYFLSERYALQVYQFEHHEAGRRYRSVKSRRPPPTGAATARPAIQRGKRRRG